MLNTWLYDVEQIVQAFLKQQGCQKSQRKIKGSANRGHQGDNFGIA